MTSMAVLQPIVELAVGMIEDFVCRADDSLAAALGLGFRRWANGSAVHRMVTGLAVGETHEPDDMPQIGTTWRPSRRP